MKKVTEYFQKIRETMFAIYSRTLAQFISTLFAHKVSILFLGIDNAGKTTLVNLLRDQKTSTRPTNHPTSSEIEICNMSANIVDLGGHEAARIAWNTYFFKCDGVVFIIDAVDTQRLDEVKTAYEMVRNCIKNQNKKIPISVLVNKKDIVLESMGNDVNAMNNHCKEVLQSVGIEENDSVKATNVTMMVGEDRKHDQAIYDSFMWLKCMVTTAEKN